MPVSSPYSQHVSQRILWGPTSASSPVDEAEYLRRWRRRTWQLHWSVLFSHLYALTLFLGHAWIGHASWAAVAGYGLWLAGGMGFITWAYASGWCHTRKDPGLFFMHQFASIVGVLGLLVAAPQVAFQAMVMLIAFSTDGFLARSRKSFWLTWIVTVIATAWIICWLGPQMRMTTDTPMGQWLAIGVVFGVVVRCSVMVTFFRSLQYRIGVANEKLATALAQIEVLVRQDEVTGLANRRGVLELLHQCCASADEGAGPLCVALLDIDHFKQINDRFGHDGGDRVLRAFGALMASQLRTRDGIGRYGGEEFLLVLPDTGLDHAGELLERMRQHVAQTPWAQAAGVDAQVTATFGAAQYVSGESVQATIARADAAMYGGKAAGRNRVVLDAPA